ncbi:DNA polymerase II [Marinobacterium mangrovicola]|uniref:DNA polymerase n=1 Tax=Marinobacterium mangrovicola TaxID=1476959 RepID=A0A4R1GJN2_9GAMM|nr:DNA polymerase II [Marinobacterium mangrovicola]TCK07400.1 DNA damage-inducible DNA polymerase II [Marinobacterium mangrovicola]
MNASDTGFVLTRQQRDVKDRIELSYWLSTAAGARRVDIQGEEAVFFILASDQERVSELLSGMNGWRLRELPLKDLSQQPICALYCRSLALWRQAIERLQQAGIGLMEEDIRPVDRYLMERFVQAGAQVIERRDGAALKPAAYDPAFRVLSIDIETTMRADRVLSVALQGPGLERVLINGQGPNESWIESCQGERHLLERSIAVINEYDPDILIGWNVIGFDLRVLEARAKACGLTFNIGRVDAGKAGAGKEPQPILVDRAQNGRWFARIPGRVVLDGIDTLKGATWRFERYGLDFVAHELLGRGKAIDKVDDRGAEIQRLYAEDRMAFAVYNLEDCRLVSEIFEHAGLIEYLIERARLTGLPLDKVGGSQQAFDNLYLPALHRQGHVAPQYASGRSDLTIPGGFVMDSRPGLYRHILVLDFKSLYPSIIRTFKIDPLGLAQGLIDDANPDDLVPGYHGAIFSRSRTLLPGIIEQLWQARDRAKAEGNAPLSQAIKIQMNACYGVLGSKICRFFDQRLSGSITLRGHQILNQTAERIEAHHGHRVIYGDTDSVFVWLGDDWPDENTAEYGQQLAAELNSWWQQRLQREFDLESALELQFEAHYERFLMPTMRHSEKGTKKRYAGLKRKAKGPSELVFRGLESVRTDWTALARDFQRELYERIFHDRPYREMLEETINRLKAGKSDDELIYHRRLRQPLDAYTHNQPPHVKAARLLEAERRSRGLPPAYGIGDSVRYLITVNGPEPLELLRSPIDYQHYIDKQLLPVADSILPFIGEHFESLVAPQIGLF